MSESIRVRSIVGRFLEHSRVFRFGEGDDARYFMGSADIMPRNLDHRVECVTEILDPRLQDRVDELIRANLDDDVLAWDLKPSGWEKVPVRRGVESQLTFQRLAERRAGLPAGS
jgi:polyphosphate kinase